MVRNREDPPPDFAALNPGYEEHTFSFSRHHASEVCK